MIECCWAPKLHSNLDTPDCQAAGDAESECSLKGENTWLPGWLEQVWLQHGMAADFIPRVSAGEGLCLPRARQGQWCAAAVVCMPGCRVSSTGHPCQGFHACLQLTTLFCPSVSKERGLALSQGHLHEGGFCGAQGVYGMQKGLSSSQPLQGHIQHQSVPTETV